MPVAPAFDSDLAEFRAFLEQAPRDGQYPAEVVRRLLQLADNAGASDVHLDPTGNALAVRWRLDGVLHALATLPRQSAPNVIARLKVLAGLLTYETALPQEGRICDGALETEVRLSTFPTLFGERAVLRILGQDDGSLADLANLGLPAKVLDELRRHLIATAGAILLVGPAGSGKTTTAYACLRHIVSQSGGGRSVASLEDPVEMAIAGVAQTQVNLAAKFDMAAGLRGLLRLDPEVIFIGEMRDRATAEIALQAALTGQLVVTTFHAGDCRDAVHRLSDIGITPYAMRNAVRLIVAQRLVRRLCSCAEEADANEHAQSLGLDVERCWIPRGCSLCRGTGYQGRSLVAEWHATEDASLASGSAIEPARGGLWASAAALVDAGVTAPLEVVRVLGFRNGSVTQ